MSYSTSASQQFAAKNRRRSSRKANANHIFGGAAIASLVLGCAWTLHANVFGAGIYPTMAGGNFDAPVIRQKSLVAARRPQAIVNPTIMSEIAIMPMAAKLVVFDTQIRRTASRKK